MRTTRAIAKGALALLLSLPVANASAASFGGGSFPAQPTGPAQLAAAAQSLLNASLRTTSRPPGQNDDSAHGYALGAFWLYGGKFWRLDDPTPGFAGWTDITSSRLPLDVVGLRVSAATVTSGGSGYAVGDVLSFAPSLTLSVLGVSAGAITSVAVTNPHWLACSPAGAQSQASTSGAGSGATFALSMLYPTGYGTRLLTRCYAGAEKQVARSDTGASFNVPFLPSGAADDASEDRFTAGNSTFNKVLVWYDQSGNPTANNATSPIGQAPVSFSGRNLGNSRSVMFSSHGDQTGGDPAGDPGITFLTIPATVTTTRRNTTLVSLAGAQTNGYAKVGMLNIGAPFNAANAGIGNDYTNNMGVYGGGTLDVGSNVRDDGSLMLATMTASSFSMYMDGTTTTGGVAADAAALTGGEIGMGAVAVYGMSDHDLDLVIPWTLTAAEQSSLEASIYQTFQIAPQGQNVVIYMGHSLVDGTGGLNQQNWVRKSTEQLGRPDFHAVNFARYADTLAHQLSNWTPRVLPTLQNYPGQRVFFMMGGDNDVGGDTALTPAATVAQVIGLYQQFNSLVHSVPGAVSICGLNAYKGLSTGSGPYPSPQLTQLGFKQIEDGVIALGTGAGGSTCDFIYDERLQPIFGDIADIARIAGGANYAPMIASGLYLSDNTHKTVLGHAVETSMFLPVLRSAIK